MDAKQLTESIPAVPAKPGESVAVMVRRIEAHFYTADVPAIVDPDTKKVLRPATTAGDYKHVLVELVAGDGRRFRKTANTPAGCRKLWKRATGL